MEASTGQALNGDDALSGEDLEDSALRGVTVLDLTQVMAGPYSCQLLADLGARVIKIEPPRGDATRRFGRFGRGEDAMAFHAVNRNKESITLDLKDPRGYEVFRRLAEQADVVVENFRPGVTSRLGIDYQTLARLNPRLIHASISGFGQTGPYASRGGYDLIAQAMSGLMSITGERGSAPVKAGVPVGDMSAALFCTIGILTALVSRQHTGRGQQVDVSLFESALSLMLWETSEHWSTGGVPQPMGSAHRLAAPYQALRAADGHFVVGASNEGLWQRFCVAIDCEDLLTDPRFVENMDRMGHLDELVEVLESRLAAQGVQHWIDVLLDAGVPAGPLYNTAEALADPHTRARDMIQTVQHPVDGVVKVLGPPVKLSDTPGRVRTAAPLLGQHCDAILAEVGFAEDEIEKLRSDGVV